MTDSPLFQGIIDWLYRRALKAEDIGDTVGGLGRKLLAGGVPVFRVNVGGMLLHPVLGALDITWEAATNAVTIRLPPRSLVTTASFQNAPFWNMAVNNIAFERHLIENPGVRNKFPILEKLADQGVTDYLAFFESYGGNRQLDWAGLPASAEGVYFSISTKRMGGFEDEEVKKIKALSLPFALAIRVATDGELATTLLETYLGEFSGRNVYSGAISRGDGQDPDCVLWFSDLRGSTELAARLPLSDYLSMINDYYDCTAGAVMDHGGEVLKFIGDGVLAIFPYDEVDRPLQDMANAAVMTCRDSMARSNAKYTLDAADDSDAMRFGIGLHVGKVMYGNVGTERRLDMTVTGQAVNEVARLETLTKTLGVPVVASEQFRSAYSGKLLSLGSKELSGIKQPMKVFTFSD